jgi:ATP-binding cassette, subfamily B, multidrug efflux pump
MKETLRDFAPVREYFTGDKAGMTLGILCLLSVDFLQLLIPLVIKRAVDHLTIGDATAGLLLHYAGIIVGIALAMALLRYIWRHLLFGISRKLEEGLRNKIFSHLLTLSASFFQRIKTGDIMARSTNDVNAVRMAAGMGLVALTDAVIMGLAAIGFMVSIDLRLTLLSLIPAPFIIYFTMVLTGRMSTGYEGIQSIFSDLTERVREAFSGIRAVKAYTREGWAIESISRDGERYVSENVRLAKTTGLFFPMMAIFTNLGLAIVIWVGGRLTIIGEISTGDLVAFISYLNLLAWPMMATGWVANLLQRGAASMRRINFILGEVPEIGDRSAQAVLRPLQGHIEYRGLSLKYQGREREAVRDVRFAIGKGKTAAIVGHVGSGKSTLLHATARLYDPPEGSLYIDGLDIRSIPLKVLRESIGFAMQEPMIFSDTVERNVLFGRKRFSEEKVIETLRTVQLLEEVQALDHGIHTLLGERGITLSGGQRQRLSIARAILADPPILILDDALSMVDTRTEERILNGILASRNGKTTVLVSHRVSTIGRADMIVVLSRGSVVEIGDHQTLLQSGKEYARLYERQILAEELEIGVFQQPAGGKG